MDDEDKATNIAASETERDQPLSPECFSAHTGLQHDSMLRGLPFNPGSYYVQSRVPNETMLGVPGMCSGMLSLNYGLQTAGFYNTAMYNGGSVNYGMQSACFCNPGNYHLNAFLRSPDYNMMQCLENYSLDGIAFDSLEEIAIKFFTGSDEQEEFVKLLLSKCNMVTLKRVDITVLLAPDSSEIKEVVERIRSVCYPNSKFQCNVHTVPLAS